jgi:alkylation response protein AidB-like acyl-CoA dehydrogenase
MDLELTEDHISFRDEVRQFSEEDVLPVAREIDEKDLFPDDIIASAGEMGLMGIIVPEEYGGLGLDLVSYVLAIEEISKACPAVALTISVNNSLTCFPIMMFGNDDQKERYLPQLASGNWLGSFALTEPGAGTDAGSISTVARKKDDVYILDGRKMFITNMGKSSLMLVFAKTSPDAGSKGISSFLVELPARGLITETPMEKMGMRGSQQMSFKMEGLEAAEENLLGKEGGGFKIALSSLDMGRLGIAAQSVGIARAALEDALDYSSKREQFGRRIFDFQSVQFKLADMMVKTEAASMMTFRAAWRMQEGASLSSDPAMAKLLASRAAVDVSGEAINVLGGRGYLKGCRVERLYRDAKITEIYEGTNDVQRMVIARDLLK